MNLSRETLKCYVFLGATIDCMWRRLQFHRIDSNRPYLTGSETATGLESGVNLTQGWTNTN